MISQNNLIVVKLGGSVFNTQKDPNAYIAAANQLELLANQYEHVIAVVSAQKGRSKELGEQLAGDDWNDLNQLLKGQDLQNKDRQRELLNKFNNPTTARALVQGEWDSVEALIEASQGRFDGITQEDSRFPIIGNDSYLRATAFPSSSTEASAKLDLKQGVTVLAGYAARTPEGNPALLGRNASDLVAALAAEHLIANALRFYKDVPGVYENFGTVNQRLIPEMRRAELQSMGPLQVLDARVLTAYQGDIEIMRFGEARPGTIITENTDEITPYTNSSHLQEQQARYHIAAR